METPIRMSPSLLVVAAAVELLLDELEAELELEDEPEDEAPEVSFLEHPVNDKPRTASDNKIPKIFFIIPPHNEIDINHINSIDTIIKQKASFVK